MLSLYTSLYNLENNLFDWQEALANFGSFSDDVVIATTAWCQDNTVKLLEKYCAEHQGFKLVVTDFSFENYAFDGNLKNAALHECKYNWRVLLDADERVCAWQKNLWLDLAKHVFEDYSDLGVDAILIPSINLCGSEREYKDIGHKFYLHNKKVSRGIPNFARLDNGKIDISKSDTTEPIDKNGDLVKSVALSNKIEDLRGANCPYVFHYWGVNPEKRINQNKFWKPHWENRAGKEVSDIILENQEIQKIPVSEHKLRMWHE